MMVPRSFEVMRIMHMRQRLLGRRFICSISNIPIRYNISFRSYSNAPAHYSACKRVLCLQSSHNDSLGIVLYRRPFSKGETKLLSSTANSEFKSTNSDSTKSNQITKNRDDEANSNNVTTTTSTSKGGAPLILNSKTTTVTCPSTAATNVPSAETKNIEIQTSKGILSVTTSIENSKIQDVVFEKKMMDAPPAPTVTKPKSEVPVDVKKLTLKSTSTLIASTATGTSKLDDKIDPVPAKPPQTIEKPSATASPSVAVAATAIVSPPPAASAVAAAPAKATVKEFILLDTPTSPAIEAPTKIKATPIIEKPVVAPLKEVKEVPKRVLVDLKRSSLERNFITPSRAMSDFLLKAADLESLVKVKRRSPYEQEPPMTVFWRKDVEAKAIQVWGSRENLIKETLKRELERKKHQQNIFTVKRRLRDYRREIGSRSVHTPEHNEPGLSGKSGRVVLIAIGINAVNFLFKVCGWIFTGSHCMFAESIHSLADTMNQVILAYGIHKSTQIPDFYHPYGYANMKYVSSLISGVGIFCVGTGLSFYHGITGLLHPEPFQDFFWAYFILGGSMVSEGATLLVAVNEVRRSAKFSGTSFKDYVLSGKDPCVNVVLMEDAAAVTSVAVAAGCMGLTSLTGMPVFDAVGSLLVGSILGAVASFIIYTNTAALVGKSISEEHLNKINAELESDVMIRAIHDVKGIDMGNSLVRYKAEMDFDGRELTRLYLDKQDLAELLRVVKSFQTIEELETFLIKHGESIVDLMGGEIDRIEMKLRKKFPEIRHCDLEIL